MFCPNEKAFVVGNVSQLGWIAVFTSALFKYLHFNHLAFYLFNTFLSAISVFIFHKLASIHLDKKLSLFITAIFAFNPAIFFYNNFILKETILMLIVVSFMYFFFKVLETGVLGYKILFLLLLPLFTTREPFCFAFLLAFAFLPDRKAKIMMLLPVVILLSVLIYYNLFPNWDWDMINKYLCSHLGNYGATKNILRQIYSQATVITFAELLTSPVLFMKYISLSIFYYLKPGMYEGFKLNCTLIPYDLFFYFIFIKTFKYRKFLKTRDSIAYSYIGIVILLISVVFLIYDPHERYRDSVTAFIFMLLVLNFKGWQKSKSLSTVSADHDIATHCQMQSNQNHVTTSA